MNENDFLQKGFAGMLQKPFNQSELNEGGKNALTHLTVSDNIPDTCQFRRKPTKLRHTQTSLITFSADGFLGG